MASLNLGKKDRYKGRKTAGGKREGMPAESVSYIWDTVGIG